MIIFKLKYKISYFLAGSSPVNFRTGRAAGFSLIDMSMCNVLVKNASYNRIGVVGLRAGAKTLELT